MLHDGLLWRANIGGGTIKGFQERERGIQTLFSLQLEEIVLVEFPTGNLPSGKAVMIEYVKDHPMYPGTTRTDAVMGPFVGKILLKGSAVNQQGRVVHVEVDPSLTIRPLNGRYYFYVSRVILEDAVQAVTAATPQVSTSHSVPDQTERVWWSASVGTTSPTAGSTSPEQLQGG